MFRLPTWAPPNTVMVRGDDLTPGDIIHLGAHLFPVRLNRVTEQTRIRITFSASRLIPRGGHLTEMPEMFSVSTTWHYVVERRIRVIRVDYKHLAAGDEILLYTGRANGGGSESRMTILFIGELFVASRSIEAHGFCRRALVSLDGGRPYPRSFTGGCLLYTVVGGPKLDAATANPRLIQRIASHNIIWKG